MRIIDQPMEVYIKPYGSVTYLTIKHDGVFYTRSNYHREDRIKWTINIKNNPKSKLSHKLQTLSDSGDNLENLYKSMVRKEKINKIINVDRNTCS